MKDKKKVCMGFFYDLVRVLYMDSETPTLKSVSIVNEFPKVFPNDLPSITPEREINFWMALAELKGLKEQLKDLLDKGFI